MKGKSVFSCQEAKVIRKILKELQQVRDVEQPDHKQQKRIRDQLREEGEFYISDFDKSGRGFTVDDFDSMIETGRIIINC